MLAASFTNPQSTHQLPVARETANCILPRHRTIKANSETCLPNSMHVAIRLQRKAQGYSGQYSSLQWNEMNLNARRAKLGTT